MAFDDALAGGAQKKRKNFDKSDEVMRRFHLVARVTSSFNSYQQILNIEGKKYATFITEY